ncbi:MAG: M14 family metallopeptidase [Patescibacteria group bacterium]
MQKYKATHAPIPIVAKPIQAEKEIVGTSVEGRAIEAYTYGTGETRLLFVGGVHGGYEWNSVLLAYQFIDYVKANPDFIPKNLTISIIPSANPDGLFRVVRKEGRFTAGDVSDSTKLVESGRFNAHSVDLNRNFDCKWKPKSMWKSKVVSAGTKAFSEPEAVAIRDFVIAHNPDSAIFWHSKANAVYASECQAGILPKTLDLMNAYAKASKYNAIKSFTAYETSGDAEGWLASINIPAITVELSTHETVEWERNLAGIKAIFNYYSRLEVANSNSGLNN